MTKKEKLKKAWEAKIERLITDKYIKKLRNLKLLNILLVAVTFLGVISLGYITSSPFWLLGFSLGMLWGVGVENLCKIKDKLREAREDKGK